MVYYGAVGAYSAAQKGRSSPRTTQKIEVELKGTNFLS